MFTWWSGDVWTSTMSFHTQIIGLQVVLPLVSILITIITAYIIVKYRRLTKMRRQYEQQGYSLQLALDHGKYAAGAPDYTFNEDILPYVSPSCLKVFCLTERMDIKLVLSLGCTFLLLVVILLPIGVYTVDVGETGEPSVDTGGFGTAAFYCLAAGIFMCCFGCIVRSCCGNRKHERLAKRQALMAVRVDAMNMVQLVPQQQYPNIPQLNQPYGHPIQFPQPQFVPQAQPVQFHPMPEGSAPPSEGTVVEGMPVANTAALGYVHPAPPFPSPPSGYAQLNATVAADAHAPILTS